MIELNVSTLSGGALVERIQDEISKAIANITDPNTPAKKARTVTMKMTIKPNEQRNMAEVSVSTSSTLCAPTPIETGIYIGMNPKTGHCVIDPLLPWPWRLRRGSSRGKVQRRGDAFTVLMSIPEQPCRAAL